jgi:hypothetical protein
MADPIQAPAAAPEVPAAAAPEQVDLDQIKQMVDLPATASDVELITVLVNLIANLQEKYEGLLADAVAMEDNMTNRDLADYADVIDEATKPFWKEQILQNRAVAVEALTSLRAKLQAPPPPAPAAPEARPEPRTIPLRNRLAAIERTVETVAEAKPAPAAFGEAVKIRNRAHEIAKSEKVPFIVAFARAEREITKE